MVKVRYGIREYNIMKKFEEIHHPDICNWISTKAGGKDMSKEVLAISDELNVFAIYLAEQCPNYNIICAVQNEMPEVELPKNVTVTNVKSFEDARKAGKFDLILLLEVSKKAGDLDKLLIMCKEMLSNEDGKIVIMARPKSPSPPLPECCRPIWRELSYTRDEILAAINNAELQSTCVSSSVPVSIGKFDWEAILYTGNITVVKMCPKCTEQEIAKFCKSQSPQVAFEEKLNVFLIRLKS